MLTTRKDLMTFVELCSPETVEMLNKIINKHTNESRIIIENEDKKENYPCCGFNDSEKDGIIRKCNMCSATWTI